MRNSPLIQTFLIAGCLGFLLLPMVRLTGSSEAKSSAVPPAVPGVDAPVTGELSCVTSIRFAHPPASVALATNGKVLWSGGDGAQTRFEFDCSLPVAEEVVEVELRVQWPGGTPVSVAEIELIPDELQSRKQTAWGEGALNEVLVFDFSK